MVGRSVASLGYRVAAAMVLVACGTDASEPSDAGAAADGTVDGDLDGSPLPNLDAATDADAAVSCPPYQTRCNGQCIPITVDPKNCGGCGVQCPPTQVCSAGTCANDCLPGLSKCNGFCVDFQTDDGNCGSCGNKCPPTEGCVAGTCKPALVLKGGPNNCPNGGGPQSFDNTDTNCTGTIAATTFAWALCSCTDITLTSSFTTVGFDSSNKSQGKLGAGVGLDKTFTASSAVDVGGSLFASSQNGLTSGSTSWVRQELQVGGNLTTQTFDVGDNGTVGGNVTGSKLTFAKTLTVSPSSTISAGVTYSKLVKQAVSVPPPCDCTKPLPISSWVSFRKTQNDNASVVPALDPTVLAASNANQPARIDLPCGSYYLDAIAAKGPLTIYAHGHTVLYIGGDVSTGSFIAFGLDPTATFDVVIGGTLTTSALFKIGSPNYPALSRTYVGTTGNLTITSNGVFATNLYAGRANVLFTSNSDTYGSIFAGNFTDTSDTLIRYDRAVVTVGQECPQKPGPDAGGCGSCKDCGNQACINGTCGQCSSSSQCCPPLQCFNGTCALQPN